MIDLDRIQRQHQAWTDYNFPNAPTDDSLIGAMEELGELAHAHLKAKQGIRGNNHESEARDAIGDIIIYLLHYCSTNGWKMSEIIEETWATVCQRDWKRNPEDGK